MRSIDRAQTLATSAGMQLRPHAKTHKSPVIAKWQIERGAVGVCCAKVGEAEVFVDAGIGNIRLPYPVNPWNAARVRALADRAAISIIVDHPDVARSWRLDRHRSTTAPSPCSRPSSRRTKGGSSSTRAARR